MELLRIWKILYKILVMEIFITNCKGYFNVYFKIDLMYIEKVKLKIIRLN